MFKKALDWLSGKKFYLLIAIAVIGILFIGLTDATFETIPAWAWIFLNAVGFGAIRDAVNSASKFDNKGWITYFASGALVVCGVLNVFGITIPVSVIAFIDSGGALGFRKALAKLQAMSG